LIFRAILGGILLVSLVLGLRLVLNSEVFTIKSIEVIGAKKISPDEIKSLVSSEIDTSRFGIFSRRNFLFVDMDNITALVQKTFPDFSKVRTSLAGLGSLVIEVIERSPYAKWCYELDKKCLIIDSKGFAFEEDRAGATTTLSIFTESKPVYATQLFDADKFSRLKRLVNYLDQSGFTINSVTENGVDYFMETPDNLEIRVNSGDDPDSIIIRLTSIEGELQNGASTVDYVDLRYGNKVFLKRK